MSTSTAAAAAPRYQYVRGTPSHVLEEFAGGELEELTGGLLEELAGEELPGGGGGAAPAATASAGFPTYAPAACCCVTPAYVFVVSPVVGSVLELAGVCGASL